MDHSRNRMKCLNCMEDARTAGTFAASCLNARRMAQRGVRNIQIFHRGWDSHGNLPRITFPV